MEKQVVLGKHLIAELWVRDPELIDNPDVVRESLLAACRKGSFSVINLAVHEFAPYGVTGVVLLAESHMSIHTWPEYGYAAVDVFTCGEEIDPWKAYEFLRDSFGAQRFEAREVTRGVFRNGLPVRDMSTFLRTERRIDERA